VKRIATFLCAIVLASAFSVLAAESSPDALVKTTADEVLNIIRTNKDKKTLRDLAEKKVLPYFDFRAMTQLAVGRHWREATPEQQNALVDAFRTLLVNTYTVSECRVHGQGKCGRETARSEGRGRRRGANDSAVAESASAHSGRLSHAQRSGRLEGV